MATTAADTGQGPIGIVAIDQYFPESERVVSDDLAEKILPSSARAYLWFMRFTGFRDWNIRLAEKKMPGTWAMALCRKRYIEDKVVASLLDQIESVINLGAGFDTLAYRVPALENVPVWEVDQPLNIKAKQKTLTKVFREVPAHVTLVPMDFNREDLGSVLASHGHAADKKTFFIMEGVTQYVSEAGVRQTFDFLKQAAAGSRLVFTYVRKDFIEGKELYGCDEIYHHFLQKNKIWHYGIAPERIVDFLDTYGWSVLEHAGYDDDLAERYLNPVGRQLETFPIERLVYAEKR